MTTNDNAEALDEQFQSIWEELTDKTPKSFQERLETQIELPMWAQDWQRLRVVKKYTWAEFADYLNQYGLPVQVNVIANNEEEDPSNSFWMTKNSTMVDYENKLRRILFVENEVAILVKYNDENELKEPIPDPSNDNDMIIKTWFKEFCQFVNPPERTRHNTTISAKWVLDCFLELNTDSAISFGSSNIGLHQVPLSAPKQMDWICQHESITLDNCAIDKSLYSNLKACQKFILVSPQTKTMDFAALIASLESCTEFHVYDDSDDTSIPWMLIVDSLVKNKNSIHKVYLEGSMDSESTTKENQLNGLYQLLEQKPNLTHLEYKIYREDFDEEESDLDDTLSCDHPSAGEESDAEEEDDNNDDDKKKPPCPKTQKVLKLIQETSTKLQHLEVDSSLRLNYQMMRGAISNLLYEREKNDWIGLGVVRRLSAMDFLSSQWVSIVLI